MEIIIAPYKDPSCALDWDEQTPEIEQRISALLREYEEYLEFSLEQRNLGKGADWPTVAVTIAGIAGTAFFVIPEVHKKIREAIEEWKIIGKNVKKLIQYISAHERVVVYPVELLLIESIVHLEQVASIEGISFGGLRVIAEPGSHEHISGLFEFTFATDSKGWKISIKGNGELFSIKPA